MCIREDGLINKFKKKKKKNGRHTEVYKMITKVWLLKESQHITL